MLAGLLEWVLALRHLVPGGYYDFLLKHSRIWDARPCPEAWAQGAPRECYRNAGTLALAHPELTYVEGVATSFIPTAHAWCVTPAGQVVDPTWANPGQCAYLGIPFKTEFLKRRLVDTEVWGIIGEHIPPEVHAADPSIFLAEAWAASVGVQAADLSAVVGARRQRM